MGLLYFVQLLALSGSEPVSSSRPKEYPVPAQLLAEYVMNVLPPWYSGAKCKLPSEGQYTYQRG